MKEESGSSLKSVNLIIASEWLHGKNPPAAHEVALDLSLSFFDAVRVLPLLTSALCSASDTDEAWVASGCSTG